MTAPAWVPCRCGDFWCRIHGTHAHDCACPEIDQWSVDPYHEGGPMPAHSFRLSIREVATNRLDLADNIPLFLTLTGRLDSPIETVLPLLRAQNAARPTVTVTLEIPDDADPS